MKELKYEDVVEILKKQDEFFYTNKTKDIKFRIEQLKKLKSAIKKYEDRIFDALYKDLRKHKVESYTTEVGLVYKSIEEAIKNLKKWSKDKQVTTPIYLLPGKSVIRYEPYGKVLIIGPFNYPFQLLIEPLIGVIAAGNCAVLKPSELSINVSRVVTEMISETFDKSYINCVQGGVDTNKSLLNANFDYIFFTGSVTVGKIVMEAASKNLTPVTLELGGKSPVIVDKDTNIKNTATKIIWGKTLNAGQTCIAPDYVFVHKDIKDELILEMKLAIEKLYGKEIDKSDSYGRIINKRHFSRLKSILDEDRDKIVYGGRHNIDDNFIEPTIIEISLRDAACMREEIFGPILPIITYDNLDKVINDINNHDKPLALYLFTENKSIEKKVIDSTSSGGVTINDTILHVSNPNLPFGGVGPAGIGSYHGEESFKTFSHKRSILKKSNKINFPVYFPPFKDNQLNLLKKFFE